MKTSGSNPSTEISNKQHKENTDKYANAMQGIKATTESREPKDLYNSSTTRSDQRNNQFMATGILSTWELPTHLQYTIPDANNQLHLLLLTHEMWELPTPLIAANKPSRENEVRELPAQPPRYTGTTRSSLNIASWYSQFNITGIASKTGLDNNMRVCNATTDIITQAQIATMTQIHDLLNGNTTTAQRPKHRKATVGSYNSTNAILPHLTPQKALTSLKAGTELTPKKLNLFYRIDRLPAHVFRSSAASPGGVIRIPTVVSEPWFSDLINTITALLYLTSLNFRLDHQKFLEFPATPPPHAAAPFTPAARTCARGSHACWPRMATGSLAASHSRPHKSLRMERPRVAATLACLARGDRLGHARWRALIGRRSRKCCAALHRWSRATRRCAMAIGWGSLLDAMRTGRVTSRPPVARCLGATRTAARCWACNSRMERRSCSGHARAFAPHEFS
ncbi:hypothetical protein F511_17612 [Dorcoceras hygrometricum]|uniref:Uncharacterized protein n=1 Tax=Dorcoceras hygrometricum TaxID=472368 RepID=A0A2Z7BCI3_9LAMI|nr:hypothetical protein F511_17612 [Dorcoceras hygrometricum]